MRKQITFLLTFIIFASCSAKKNEMIQPDWLVDTSVKVNAAGFDPFYKLIKSDPVQDKNFYLFTALLKDATLKQQISHDLELGKIFKKYQSRISSYLTAPQADSLKFLPDEIAMVAKSFDRLASTGAFTPLLKSQLRPCGKFENYKDLSDSQLLMRAWQDAAKSINSIIDVYFAALPPKYPLIDGPLQDISSKTYTASVVAGVEQIITSVNSSTAFFEPALKIALLGLSLNGRNEAGRYEPLEVGENKAAIVAIPSIQWNNFQYSVIICPGDAPNSPGDEPELSEGGKSRVRVAAQRYLQGLAPFIIMTGANVFPKGSSFYEGVEMKKYILKNFPMIPEQAIIVEPHARHTHTNLRNSVRLIFRYGIPEAKKVLIATTASQAKYITGSEFAQRCITDFGYLPMTDYKLISLTDIEASPLKVSLHVLSIDPLDP